MMPAFPIAQPARGASEPRRRPMLASRAAHPVGIDGRSLNQVVDERVGEVGGIGLLDDPVARQRQYAGSSTASAVVVPETRSDAAGQSGARHGVPAAFGEGGPDAISSVTSARTRNTWASPLGPLHQP